MTSIGKRPSSATSDIKLVQQKGLIFAYINRSVTLYFKRIPTFAYKEVVANVCYTKIITF